MKHDDSSKWRRQQWRIPLQIYISLYPKLSLEYYQGFLCTVLAYCTFTCKNNKVPSDIYLYNVFYLDTNKQMNTRVLILHVKLCQLKTFFDMSKKVQFYSNYSYYPTVPLNNFSTNRVLLLLLLQY